MNYSIEELNLNNIRDYVKVNAKAWQETYKGIVNEEFLELFNTEKEINNSIERIKKSLDNPFNKSFLLKVDNNYVGVFKICKARDTTYQNTGELQALYLLNEVKHMGYGKKLFEKAKQELKKMGFNSMLVGCLSDNTNANAFYKHMKGELASNRDFTITNQTLKENVYLFRI